MAAPCFEIICEIEPATTPDLRGVRLEVATLSQLSSRFLIPDNHLGRAAVSSIAVAREVAQLGAAAIACLNARDRNRLGFARDLLTAAAYGIGEFLFVAGDRPESGRRSDDLTVQMMLEQARHFAARHGGTELRLGVASAGGSLPRWKRDADFVFCQVGFSLPELLARREALGFDGKVYAGVIVLSSAAMACKLAAEIPDLNVPDDLVAALERDRDAGVHAACALVEALAASGAFDGVHLVPVRRYRQVAQLLEGRHLGR
ncbi:MAG: methylenetetrahydrofolate reductase [Actinomycetota bacterium]|nr:methylenetetrahydrofolate reductase [Actinomycetota bacterium]